jgi:hypothetical protein
MLRVTRKEEIRDVLDDHRVPTLKEAGQPVFVWDDANQDSANGEDRDGYSTERAEHSAAGPLPSGEEIGAAADGSCAGGEHRAVSSGDDGTGQPGNGGNVTHGPGAALRPLTPGPLSPPSSSDSGVGGWADPVHVSPPATMRRRSPQVAGKPELN